MKFIGSCGQQGYRSNGTYVEGWHGVCGTGNPYYLLCSTCRDRYLAENRAMSDSADCASRNIPYAKLLLMAPDLLGSTEKTEQGMYKLLLKTTYIFKILFNCCFLLIFLYTYIFCRFQHSVAVSL